MKTLLLFSFIFLFVISGNAQKPYSEENLKNLSQEELDVYFKKAKKQKKTGAIMSVAGPVSVAVGIFLTLASDPYDPSDNNVGGNLFAAAGLVTTIVGIPVLISGSSRVNTINKIKNSKLNGVTMEIVPIGFYDYQTQNIQPGISFRIRF